MRLSLLTVSLTVLAATALRAADEFPSWAREAAAMTAPKYDGKVPAVVLLDEQRLAIEDSGKRTCTTRHVIRVLNREGRRIAIAREQYLTGTGKIREFRAWMLAPGGDTKKYGKDRTLDLALADNDIYNEYRVRAINAESDADPGSVFAYEAVSEDKSIFTQWEWSFQGRLPVLVSRFTLTLPSGWRSEAVSFNTKPLAPAVSENTSTWELRNLPFIEDEPSSPSVSSLAPRLGVTFFPAGGAKNAGPSFSSWTDVSRFQSDLAEPQLTSTGAMVDKAKALAADGPELQRLAGVAKFVQGVNYIAIQTNLGRGGGYRPHAAADVFTKAYGDCKDKANLLRAMLKAVGIDAYLVAVYSGDRAHAREEWPSPWQFNHMIVAIKVAPETRAPAVLENSPLGRLLIFDPTDDVTPLGYLPVDEQDSYALLIAPEKGGLVKLPLAPPSTNRVERETTVTLDAAGAIRASVQERRFGDPATLAHRRYVLRSRPDYLKSVEQMVSRTVTAARVSRVEPVAGKSASEFQLGLEFEGPTYAQIMQGRLMMFRPVVLQGGLRYDFAAEKRSYPVVLDAEVFRETVRATLPGEFEMDELPDPVNLNTPFGTYRATYAVKDRVLTLTRELEVKASTIPASGYSDVRKFFALVYGSEQAPAVLVRK